jgi:hypothetical protein
MDAGAGAHYSARTAEEVFRDFRGRRAGMIKALTNGIRPFLCSAAGFRSPTASLLPKRLTQLLVSLVFADVEKFYQLCDPGESIRSPRV